jgi:hypothetical protein
MQIYYFEAKFAHDKSQAPINKKKFSPHQIVEIK